MELASIVNEYYDSFVKEHAHHLLPDHLKALRAIQNCRTQEGGELYVRCPACHHSEWRPLSCGHRSCPKCQNHETSEWIDRQQGKLLPVPYFMVTFTLPYEFRPLAWCNPKQIYALLFTCAAGTLKDFGLNTRNLGAEIGMTLVLHTHSRKLDFHPHIHSVVPGGGVDKRRRQWKKKKGKFLFNQESLAKIFRARLLSAIKQEKLTLPRNAPQKWVVDCHYVGKGISALKYLSRYLYRGVISENNIISNKNGRVTFRYIESKTGETRYRTLKGEDFLFLIVQHVLPKGFRRVRDYGFLHSNAKKLLRLVQLILYVSFGNVPVRMRPVFKCPLCNSPMAITGIRRHRMAAG